MVPSFHRFLDNDVRAFIVTTATYSLVTGLTTVWTDLPKLSAKINVFAFVT